MRRLVIIGAVIVLIACGAGYYLSRLGGKISSLIPSPDECTATVSGHEVVLTPDQGQNAALISAIAVHRGLPAHAATIALATALQESKLYNLTGGDRDSLGLFQQRPSQGWGTKQQIMDPVYATNKFYDALVKLPDFQTISVTEAAQAVQHSAYPDAYAKHEADARVLASALTGFSPHTFGCRQDTPSKVAQALPVRKEVHSLFGVTGVIRGQELSIPTQDATLGWAIAQYLVAQGPRFDLYAIEYDGWRWSSGDDGTWQESSATAGGQVTVRLG
jgi:hypothetical protein